MAAGNNIGQTYKYTIGGRTYTVNPASGGGYMQAYNQYATDAAASKALYEQQYNANVSNVNKTLEQNNATTNANYDNSARQAYVDYMRNQRALPSQLQALGVRGGATESGLLNLYNNYGTEHAANEQQRNADLTSNQQARDDALTQLAADRTQYLMDYEKDLADKKQTAINNQINEYNNEITRFSSSVAQYPTTAAGYKAYENWIKALEASNDPLKGIKIGLVRQQMATQFPNGNPENQSSGSGGGGGSSRGRGRGRSYGGGGGGGSNPTPSNAGYKGNTRQAYEQRFGSSRRGNSGNSRGSSRGRGSATKGGTRYSNKGRGRSNYAGGWRYQG